MSRTDGEYNLTPFHIIPTFNNYIDFDSETHINPYYNFHNVFDNDLKNLKTMFKQLIHDIQSLKDEPILENYCKSGGTLDDTYNHYQGGNGEHIIVSIPVTIVLSGNINQMKKLIEMDKSYVDYIEAYNQSILSIAIINGKTEIAEFLLENGADPNMAGHRGKTPLYFAIVSKNPYMVNKLLQYNATNAINKYLLDALSYANSRKLEGQKIDDDDIRIIHLLVEADARIEDIEVNEDLQTIYWTTMNFYGVKNGLVFRYDNLLKHEREQLRL